MSLTVVILAAGKSTRFKSQTSKVLHLLGERPLIDYSLSAASTLSAELPVLVVGPQTESEIHAALGERARYVTQKERLGTGHALLQTQTLLQGHAKQILVLYGDMPLLQTETLRELAQLHTTSGAAIAMLTVTRPDPQGFGRIVRNAEGQIKCIVEEAEATAEQRAIRELNVGIYVFEAGFLWDHLQHLQPSARKGEYYLTDLVAIAVQEGREVVNVLIADPIEALGINTRSDMAIAAAAQRRRINERWMESGVTLIDPQNTYIGPHVQIGSDSTIHPNTHLRGQTTIGAHCELGPNSIIDTCEIGQRCRVQASVLENAVMEDDSDIGPFGHLRKGAHLCQGAHMGNFGEMKNSTLGRNSKMGHFSYLGDAEIGENVNIGAGTITCNYDGAKKHRTHIEDNVFIGSDAMLVAPLHIGEGARIGAGSVVTHDVPPHSLAYGVPARIKDTPATRKAEEQPEDDASTK